jgi:hypothetical protein
MNSIVDKLAYGASLAKWKANQQGRIFSVQGNIRDLENQIRIQKSNLAEAAVELHRQGALNNPQLIAIGDGIAVIYAQIIAAKQSLETIQQEQPPIDPSGYSAQNEPNPVMSGLVCPICGKELVGDFCSIHGVHGVHPPSNSGLICPECGKILLGQFCPEHGTAGVPNQNQVDQ